ncbi:unnamed protein product [Didymodactylos carnosus]|uniref:Uncharacterized protein n=1 Tax=Didymodactylos carnosus TaxID=1234261 RepID=A0A814ELK8_9BILA|nr:unnamed protein product [Didymodactylos carnosus]CAF0972887.1 unnamed protein product [Didymodactylos carnosus]CAF3570255.1 unnamed protein product [Didymodactylos carnosus]CAF3745824.1 unnamed protein product [Didymodactylos carnosus]
MATYPSDYQSYNYHHNSTHDTEPWNYVYVQEEEELEEHKSDDEELDQLRQAALQTLQNKKKNHPSILSSRKYSRHYYSRSRSCSSISSSGTSCSTSSDSRSSYTSRSSSRSTYHHGKDRDYRFDPPASGVQMNDSANDVDEREFKQSDYLQGTEFISDDEDGVQPRQQIVLTEQPHVQDDTFILHCQIQQDEDLLLDDTQQQQQQHYSNDRHRTRPSSARSKDEKPQPSQTASLLSDSTPTAVTVHINSSNFDLRQLIKNRHRPITPLPSEEIQQVESTPSSDRLVQIIPTRKSISVEVNNNKRKRSVHERLSSSSTLTTKRK